MAKNLWWVTRPTRDLHDLPEALECFAELAQNKKWKGNRKLHQEFERTNPAKTPNSGKFGSAGSGGRTWAAWLRSWGMWYDDKEVKLTDAARLILSAKDSSPVHKQIVHQIMCFQQTSAYHQSLGCEPGFRIFPFRFMIRMLLDSRVGHLGLDEIGLFLLQVRTSDEYERTVRAILAWRKKATSQESKKALKNTLIAHHMKKYHLPRKDSPGTPEGHWRSVMDVANTFAINLGYVAEVDYNRRRSAVTVRDKGRDTLTRLLAKYEDDIPFSTLYEHSEAAFARRMGVRYDRRKASTKETRPRTAAQKRLGRISDAVSELRRQGTAKDGQGLVRQIMKITNYDAATVSQVLEDNPGMLPRATGSLDREFEEYYMECALSGGEHGEFEDLTRKLFDNLGFGTAGKTRIPGDGEIDGLILNSQTGMSGLLECKSGSKYSFTIGDRDKMAFSYIPHFKTKRISKKPYALDFFVYVVGAKAAGMGNLKKIVANTGIHGSVIYARDLLHLYALVKANKISPVKMWSMFKCDGHITRTDIESSVQ